MADPIIKIKVEGSGLPAGGADGQVLTRKGGRAVWGDPPAGLTEEINQLPVADALAENTNVLIEADGSTQRIPAEKIVPKGMVKTVNNAAPDENGNVNIEVPAPIAIDSTLTQSGQAADAAAVGEKVSQLSEEKADKAAVNTLSGHMNDYMWKVIKCLEHVAWSTTDGQLYYDALKAKYDEYNGSESPTAKSNSLSVDDASFRNGFIKDDGSIDTTTNYQQNFFWDKFVECKAFLFVDENGAYVPVAHKYASYSEDKSIIAAGYSDAVTTPTATSLVSLDGAFYKLGFKQDTLTVDRALVANTKMDTLCTVEDTTLDTSGAAVYYAGRIASDYIQLYDNTPILLCRPHDGVFIACLYDADRALIDRQIGVAGTNATTIITVPENAKYVRVCTTAETNVYTSLEMA